MYCDSCLIKYHPVCSRRSLDYHGNRLVIIIHVDKYNNAIVMILEKAVTNFVPICPYMPHSVDYQIICSLSMRHVHNSF